MEKSTGRFPELWLFYERYIRQRQIRFLKIKNAPTEVSAKKKACLSTSLKFLILFSENFRKESDDFCLIGKEYNQPDGQNQNHEQRNADGRRENNFSSLGT